jgi:hypothetical protein
MEERDGNDMRNMPVGRQELAKVPYLITDPAKNGRKAVVAVRRNAAALPEQVTIAVQKKAGALYLIHTLNNCGPSGIAGAVTLLYDDGTRFETYMKKDDQVSGWWFPTIKASPTAGIAWRGPNGITNDVGVCWLALDNPHPDKTIRSITIGAPYEGGTYAVLALTLADKGPQRKPSPVSTGGPGRWSGGTCMAALIEGLAGVRNNTTRLEDVTVSPRWTAAGTEAVEVTAHYPVSDGYVAYRFYHDAQRRTISMQVTGSGNKGTVRALLPSGVTTVREAHVAGAAVPCHVEQVEQSSYAVVALAALTPVQISIAY